MSAIDHMHKNYGKNEKHWCWDCQQLLNYPQGTCTCEHHPARPLWQRDWYACGMWKSICPSWKRVPDVIEEDGQRLGAHYVLKEYP